MADEQRTPSGETPPPAAPQQQQPQQVQIQIPVDASGLAASYANWFRLTGSDEELVLDLGLTTQLGLFLVPQQNPPQPEPIKLNHRVVMSFHTAKRLVGVLQQLLMQYERRYGVIELDPRRRGAGGPPAARPASS